MRNTTIRSLLLLCWALSGLVVCFPSACGAMGSLNNNKEEATDQGAAGKSSEEASPTLPEEGESPVEENPDYVDPANALSDNDDGDDSDSDDDGVQSFDDSVKGQISQALAHSRKRSRQAKKLVKKHRAEITLVLALFAFRREIRQALIHVLTKELRDPRTGRLRVSPTTMLKLALFVQFVLRLQAQSQQGTQSSPQLQHMFSTIGQANPLFGSFFTKILKIPVYNPAYLPPLVQHYSFERLNEQYVKDGLAFHKAINAKQDKFEWPSSSISTDKNATAVGITRRNSTSEDKTVVVVDMTGLASSLGSKMESIRDQVSFLLSQYREAAMSSSDALLEVVVLLESPGGSAADYGLAAQQLLRLRNEPGLNLTICVDKVAASGGYMMACTAEKLLAAPFALVGSIGVLGQLVNVQNLLEGWGVLPLVFRGGKDKAPVGMLGEVTKDGKEKVQSMVDDTHAAFQQHVLASRPQLKKRLSQVGNGHVWMGSAALDLGLIDDITTSDEYIHDKIRQGARVLKLIKNPRRSRFLFGSRVAHPYDQPHFRHSWAVTLRDTVSQVLSKASDWLSISKLDMAESGNVPDLRLLHTSGVQATHKAPF